MEKRLIPSAKYVAVLQHGNAVLIRAGLARLSYEEREAKISELLLNGECARWGNWRLVLNGKEHPPKFKTEAQWRKAFAK